jgi:hypothetical protein
MRTSLGSWMSTLRRRPPESDLLASGRGWQPLPDDVAEWMGAKPFQLEETA